jgi:glycosyltransferase involved in cell wall biosynthesis
MRILQVIPGYYPAFAYGGPVRVAHRISRALVKRGHEVTVFTSDSLDRYTRCDRALDYVDGVEIHYFRNIVNKLAWDFRLFLTPGMPRYLKKSVEGFDVVHLHEFYTLQNVAAHYYCTRASVPYVLQSHGSLVPKGEKELSKRIFRRTLGRGILPEAARAIALTQTESRNYAMMGVAPSKIDIIPTGIDLADYDHLPERGAFRQKHGLNHDEWIVLYVGRLHKTKGLDLLVRAFARFENGRGDSRLVLVGPDDGAMAPVKSLVKLLGVEDKVVFTGFVGDEEKRRAIIDSDVFVTPRFSGFPSTFLEACACGIPVITTSEGDELDWIDNQVGFVVKDNEIDLSEAIARILSDGDLRRRFGKNGQELVRRRFSWEVLIGMFEDTYSKAVRLSDLK